MMQPFLAIDWGTTNRRIYRIDSDGSAVELERDSQGVLAVPQGGFEAELAAIRERFGDLPALCSGMVGSNRGWTETPYIPCPADIGALAGNLSWIEPGRTAITAGVIDASDDRCDVMRGEELQFLGAIAGGMAPASSLLCQPGTHCKWAWTEHGRIERFATAMTGELFALLRAHSLLAPQLGDDVALDASFSAGLADAADGDLMTRLFRVRADAVSRTHAIANPASYLSGLLIGTDSLRQVMPGTTVHVLSDAALGPLYGAAIEAAGGVPVPLDCRTAFVQGAIHIWRSIA